MTGSSDSRKKFVVGTLAAAFVVTAILVLFVLPAEYGFDPTGVGAAVGLTDLSEPSMNEEQKRGARRQGVLIVMDSMPTTESTGLKDHWEFVLEPYQSVEFKYTIAEGETMVFGWRATALVNYDMHAHPFDGGEELTESYSVGKADSMYGRYNPAFTGIHGWYWQNRTLSVVRLTLDAAGGFTTSTVYDGKVARPRPINEATP